MTKLPRNRATIVKPIISAISTITAAGAIAALMTACASTGGSAGGPATSTPVQAVITGPSLATQWPIKTRENVDVWLHGFALLQQDSSLVPFFRRGYTDDLTVLKNRANVITQLDVNRDKLRNGLGSSRTLIGAQFVPFYFSSVDEMRTVIDHFISAQGNPQSARSQQEAAQFAVLASYFPTGVERSWLSLYASSVWDEDAKFYHSYWVHQQRQRANVVDSVQGMWQHLMRPRMQRFLNNTQQRDGDIILSLPLDGEGRSLNGGGVVRNAVGVTFPDRPADAPHALYVIAHELVSGIATVAINDNTTPAEQRGGAADRYASAAAVRGGLMLLEKLVPELADGYARYYITATGRTPGANPRAEIVGVFPLPDAIRDEIARQIESVQGGI